MNGLAPHVMNDGEQVSPALLQPFERFSFADHLAQINDAIVQLDNSVDTGVIAACRRRVGRVARRASTFLQMNYAPGGDLQQLRSALWATPYVEALLNGLDSVARHEIDELPVEDLREAFVLVREAIFFIARRQSTVAALRLLPDNAGASDRIFDLKVHFDVRCPGTLGGALGMLISARASLVGHVGQTLAFRVKLSADGVPVRVREEWESWGERSRLELAGVERQPIFAALIPLAATGQRVLIDDVQCFVPYQALDVPAHRCRLGIAASIASERGETVCSMELHELVHIVRSTGELPIPAASESGLWPRDTIAGFSMDDCAVRFESCDWSGTALLSAVVHCNVTRTAADAQRSILELRVRDGAGAYLGSVDRLFRSPHGEFLAREVVELSTLPIAISPYRIRFPLGALDLSPGNHRLILEVVLRRADGKILCGTLLPIVSTITHDEQSAARSVQHDQIQVQSGSFLKRMLRAFVSTGEISDGL